MKKYLFFAAAIAATLASCSSEAEDTPAVDNGQQKQKVLLSSKPFEFDDVATRVAFTLNEEKGLQFAWEYNETFGVFPIAPVNNQAVWHLTRSDEVASDPNYAVFDGQGWGLEDGTTYAAYHPYNGNLASNTPPTEIPVSLPEQQGGTLNAIAAYDYMCAVRGYYDIDNEYSDFADPVDPGTPHKRNVEFDFFHAISIIQIKVPSTVTSLTVTGTFMTSGTWDIATVGVNTWNKVTGTAEEKTISLSAPEEIKDGKAIFYLATFPTTTGECIINTGDISYQVASKTLKANKAYRWSVGD